MTSSWFSLALGPSLMGWGRWCHHAVRKPKLVHAERLHGEAHVEGNWGPWPQARLSRQTWEWTRLPVSAAPAFRSSSWGSRHCGVEISHPWWALSEFIREPNKWLYYATTFQRNLLHSYSNWNISVSWAELGFLEPGRPVFKSPLWHLALWPSADFTQIPWTWSSSFLPHRVIIKMKGDNAGEAF